MLRGRIRGLFGQEERTPEAMWDGVYRIEYNHKDKKVLTFFKDEEGKQTEEIEGIVSVEFNKCEPSILILRTDVSIVEPEEGYHFEMDKVGRAIHVWPEGH